MTEQRMARCPHVDPQRGQCVYADGHSCECLPEALAYAAPASAPQKLRRAALELRGAVLDANELEAAVAKGEDIDGTKLGVRERVELIGKVARTVERASRAARETMSMERILLGEPTEILGVREVGELTPEESIQELEEGAIAAKRHRARMEKLQRTRERFGLIQGGKASGGKDSDGEEESA